MFELVEVTVRVPDEAGDGEEARGLIASSLVKAVLDRNVSAFAEAGCSVVHVEAAGEVGE